MSCRRAATIALLLFQLAIVEYLTAAESDPVYRGRWPGYTRGPAYAVVLRDQYAFAAARAGGLISIDVSAPSAPRRIGSHATGAAASDVAIEGDFAYVADERFSGRRSCKRCGAGFAEFTPQSFSFNSPLGMCPACGGLGRRVEMAPNLVVPDPSL